jgi:hypothetical protein
MEEPGDNEEDLLQWLWEVRDELVREMRDVAESFLGGVRATGLVTREIRFTQPAPDDERENRFEQRVRMGFMRPFRDNPDQPYLVARNFIQLAADLGIAQIRLAAYEHYWADGQRDGSDPIFRRARKYDGFWERAYYHCRAFLALGLPVVGSTPVTSLPSPPPPGSPRPEQAMIKALTPPPNKPLLAQWHQGYRGTGQQPLFLQVKMALRHEDSLPIPWPTTGYVSMHVSNGPAVRQMQDYMPVDGGRRRRNTIPALALSRVYMTPPSSFSPPYATTLYLADPACKEVGYDAPNGVLYKPMPEPAPPLVLASVQDPGQGPPYRVDLELAVNQSSVTVEVYAMDMMLDKVDVEDFLLALGSRTAIPSLVYACLQRAIGDRREPSERVVSATKRLRSQAVESMELNMDERARLKLYFEARDSLRVSLEKRLLPETEPHLGAYQLEGYGLLMQLGFFTLEELYALPVWSGQLPPETRVLGPFSPRLRPSEEETKAQAKALAQYFADKITLLSSMASVAVLWAVTGIDLIWDALVTLVGAWLFTRANPITSLFRVLRRLFGFVLSVGRDPLYIGRAYRALTRYLQVRHIRNREPVLNAEDLLARLWDAPDGVETIRINWACPHVEAQHGLATHVHRVTGQLVCKECARRI